MFETHLSRWRIILTWQISGQVTPNATGGGSRKCLRRVGERRHGCGLRGNGRGNGAVSLGPTFGQEFLRTLLVELRQNLRKYRPLTSGMGCYVVHRNV